MPTAPEAQPTTTFGPTSETIDAYKELVFATARGEHTDPAKRETTLEEAWRLEEHFEQDVSTFRRRLKARRTLDAKVPELKRRAAQLKVEADRMRAERLGQKPPTDFETLAELAAAVEVLRSARDPSVLITTSEHRRWREAEMNAGSVRRSAIDLLRRTCDPETDNELTAVSRQIEGLRVRIGERE